MPKVKTKYLVIQEMILQSIQESDVFPVHWPKYVYLAHYLNWYNLNHRDFDNDFVPIYKQLFQKTVGMRYEKKIFDFFLENGFIEINHSYSTTKHQSKGYKFTNKALGSDLTFFESRNKALNKKLHQNFEPTEEIEKTVFQNLQLIHFNFTYSSHNNLNKIYTNNTPPAHSPHYVNTEITQSTSETNNYLANTSYRSKLDMIAIANFKSKNFYAKRDPNVRRLHTNLTSLKSDLRQYVKVPGLDLVNVDIRNSQPTILNTLFQGDQKYTEFTTRGLLWDHLTQRCDFSNRKQLKEQMFKSVFYGRTDTMETSRMSKIFRKEFPQAWEYIYNFKKKHGYKALSIEMQRKESEIMLERICPVLMKEKKWFSTIHDSVVTDRSNAEYAEQIIKTSFKGEYGLNVETKIEKI
jgi:hypothetical protein